MTADDNYYHFDAMGCGIVLFSLTLWDGQSFLNFGSILKADDCFLQVPYCRTTNSLRYSIFTYCITGLAGGPGLFNKKITGKTDVGFVSDKLRGHPSKVKATTASIPVDGHQNSIISQSRPTAQGELCDRLGPACGILDA